MEENRIIKFTGGSRIGYNNLTIPFATLNISDEKLELKRLGFQPLIFNPENLENIEEVYYFPIIAQGIRIKHTKYEYDNNIIFWSLCNPKKIIREIRNRGLIHSKSGLEVPGSNTNKKLGIPPIAIISFLAFILFGGTMIYLDSRKFDNYSTLSKSSEIQLEVNKMRVDHAESFINNRYIVPSGTKLISSRPHWFKEKFQPIGGKNSDQNPYFNDLEEPFKILKNQNSFELKVIKHNDTLIFKMPDPNYKDPNDPTFRDLYEQLTRD